MKEAMEEIQAFRRTFLDPTHLIAFALGCIAPAVLFLAIGRDDESVATPLHSGPLSFVAKQEDSNTRSSNSFTEGEDVRGRLYDDFLIIEYPGSVDVVPAHRLLGVTFRR